MRCFARALSFSLAIFAGLVLPSVLTSQADDPAVGLARAETTSDAPWCAPELTPLSEQVCFFRAKQQPTPKTLVIFLHSLIGAEARAAWPQQRRMVNSAQAYGFAALVPRGRPGLGPGRDPRVLAWPTALELQKQVESELLQQWREAVEHVEAESGRFERVLLFGFSNGAYYASNLAFREAVQVDGVAAFAGGSGSKYQRLLASRSKRRVPIFVGYGTQDPDHQRQQQMIEMLRQINWPHRARADAVGHTVTDAQLRAALAFLGHPLSEAFPARHRRK